LVDVEKATLVMASLVLDSVYKIGVKERTGAMVVLDIPVRRNGLYVEVV
jgi:hypothetical protein